MVAAVLDRDDVAVAWVGEGKAIVAEGVNVVKEDAVDETGRWLVELDMEGEYDGSGCVMESVWSIAVKFSVSSISSSESSKAVMSAAERFRRGLDVWLRAGAVRRLEEHLCVLKQVAWTVALQRKQGTGLELPWNIFLQSSQQGCEEDFGRAGEGA